MANKKPHIVVDGHGIRVQGGFISKKFYERLINADISEDEYDSLPDHSDEFHFSGVSQQSFRVLLNDEEICESIEGIPSFYTLTVPPEKEFLTFKGNQKYGLIMVEYEKGIWYDDRISNLDPEKLVFINRRIEIAPTTYFSFLNVFYDGQELEQSETITTNQEFYIVNSDGNIKELDFDF